jgi:hypothetical protein
MNEDPCCKSCEHPLSVHNMERAQKRASMTGTMVSDYPSAQGYFNYHSGMTDGDACSDADCACIMFVSHS